MLKSQLNEERVRRNKPANLSALNSIQGTKPKRLGARADKSLLNSNRNHFRGNRRFMRDMVFVR